MAHDRHTPLMLAEVIAKAEETARGADCPDCAEDAKRLAGWLKMLSPLDTKRREPELPGQTTMPFIEAMRPLTPDVILTDEEFDKVLDRVTDPNPQPTEALVKLLAGEPTGVEEPEGGVWASTPMGAPCTCGKALIPMGAPYQIEPQVNGDWFTHRPAPLPCGAGYHCDVCGTTDPIQHWYHPPAPGEES